MEQKTLHTILEHFGKPELRDIADILGLPVNMRSKKAQIEQQLYDYLVTEPRQWMSHLLERDVRLLKDLVHAGPENVQYIDHADYPSFVEVVGIVQFDDSDDNFHKVWITREIYDIVSSQVDKVIHALERNGQYRLERLALGYLNFYGILPTEMFVEKVTDWFELQYGSNYKRLSRLLHTTPIVKLYRYVDKWGDYICSPCVSDVDEIMSLRESLKQEHYPELDSWNAYDSGVGSPFFKVGMNEYHGMLMEQIFIKLGYKDDELVKAIHDTWMESQFTSIPNAALYDAILDSPRAPELDDATYESYCNIVADYADNAPKWCLCGLSAKKTGKCLADRTVWDTQKLSKSQASQNEEYPKWEMPDPTITDGYAAEMNSDGYPLGLAIPHVAPNDPCPCGSGLRYCRCHGRYMN